MKAREHAREMPRLTLASLGLRDSTYLLTHVMARGPGSCPGIVLYLES